MIISKTPFRMSFFGGGTDIPDFFNEYGGSVISTTFNKYCYVNLRPLPKFHNYSSEVIYNKIERVNSIEEIKHPLIRECMMQNNVNGIKLTYEAELPARSGLGSSSTFAVGMLNAIHALKSETVGKRKLAEEAIKIERELLNEYGGWQDQISVSYGGLNRIDFSSIDFSVKPIILSDKRKNELDDNLLLFYIGMNRMSHEIQTNTFSNMKDKVVYLKEILLLVDEAEKILCDSSKSIDELGVLLGETWKIKRSMGSNITNSTIDDVYSTGISAGALGGKLLGAGGGGFILFYCQKEKQNELRKKLNNMVEVPFTFEDKGTHILYYG